MDTATGIGLGISLLALLATVVVGVLRFRHERKLADTADARAVLADGALELGRAKGALKDALTAFDLPLSSGQPGNWPMDFGAKIRELEAAADALEAAVTVVRIRLPKRSLVVREIDAAYQDVRSIMASYRQAWQRDLSGDRKGADKDSEAVWNLSLDFDARREAFLEAAQVAVGAKLGRAKRGLAADPVPAAQRPAA
jgi:hypothetical protein